MDTRTSFLLSLAAIAVGVLMIVFNPSVGANDIVLGGGILLLAAGVIDILITNISVSQANKKAQREADKNKKNRQDADNAAPVVGRGFAFWLTMVVSAAAAIFGIVVISTPTAWVEYIPVIFGLVTVVAAIMLFYQLAMGARPATIPSWLYIPASLVAIGAIVDFFLKSPAQDRVMMCVTGAAFCVFGVTMLIIGSIMTAFHKADHKEEALKVEKKSEEEEAPEKPVPLDDEKN